MPISEAPTNLNEPRGPNQESGDPEEVALALEQAPTEAESPAPAAQSSRWVDYNTHELLEMIGELEDERRWSRLREGIWIAILIHFILLSVITWIPRYVFKEPPVVNPFDVLKQKDLVYLNPPRLHGPPKVKPKPLPPVDRKTLEALNHTPPAPVEKTPAPAPPPEPVQKASEVKSQPTQPIPPSPKAQVPAPRPAPVPAKPNFLAMTQGDPSQQLQRAMRHAMQGRGSGQINAPIPGGLSMHPGATGGGVQILSNTQGVDFNAWLRAWYYDTEQTWDPLIPDEVNPPISKSGQVMVRFKVLPNGRVMDGSMVLEGSSGDAALDRAAWGAITGSSYPPLPRNFHGPYIELRALFLYNMRPPSQ